MNRLVIVLSVLFCSCNAGTDTKSVEKKRISINASPAAFDVKPLFGLTIDQIKAKMGRPTNEMESNESGSERSYTYRRGHYELLIDFYVKTRKVSAFLFAATDTSQSYNQLLRASGLSETSPIYKPQVAQWPNGKYQTAVLINMESANDTDE